MESFILHFSESTSLYLYSSFLQANAAIIAIVGLFIVFKIQFHLNSIDVIKTSLMQDRKGINIHPSKVEGFDRALMDKKKKLFEEMKTSNEVDFIFLFQSWIEKLEKYNTIKSKIVLPTILLTIGIIITAIALLSSSNLNLFYPNLEVITAYVITFYHVLVWGYVAKVIITTVRND